MTPQEQYIEELKKKQAASSGTSEAPVSDQGASTQEDAASLATKEKADKADKENMNGYVAAAGVALKGAGMIDNAVRATNNSKIDNYNKKIMAQRASVRNMFA